MIWGERFIPATHINNLQQEAPYQVVLFNPN